VLVERAAALAGVMSIEDNEGDGECVGAWLDQRELSCIVAFVPCNKVFIRTANSIPLQALGVVDVAGTDVADNEVLAHELMNVSQKDKQGGWAI
jgi:hypothetical protein